MTVAQLLQIPTCLTPGIRSWLAAAVLCCLAMSLQLNASWQTPLNDEEIKKAADAAMSQYASGATARPDGVGLRSISSTGTAHPLGVQVLLIELKEQKRPADQASRIAEVFLFNYLRGVTEFKLFDVERNELIATRDIPSVHLPLADTEISYSKALIWNNPEFIERIRTEYEAVQSLSAGDSDLADLQTRVSIWVPNGSTEAHENCSSERCALISLFTQANYSFSIEPVVNLMSGEIYLDTVR